MSGVLKSVPNGEKKNKAYSLEPSYAYFIVDYKQGLIRVC